MKKTVVIFCTVFVLCFLLLVMPSAAANITATVSHSIITQGDSIFISGTADNNPLEVAIWVLGMNYAFLTTTRVNLDGTFSYGIPQQTTNLLDAGQYYIVVQHPMQNEIFDIDSLELRAAMVPAYVYDYSGMTVVSIFKISGVGALRGFDAAEELVQGINRPSVDDTYVMRQFQVISSSGIGIFRPSTGYWYFDYNLDGFVDKSFRYGGSTDQIITGDWDGDGKDGIAIFRPSTGYWYFDYNLDGIVNKSFRYGGVGDQIAKGDWTGHGSDGIAIFRPSTGYWYFDYNLDGFVDRSFRYGGSTDRITVGKWE